MPKNIIINNKTYTGINKVKIRIPGTETFHEFFITDDATATASDIVAGKTAYASNQKVLGAFQGTTQPGWEGATGYTVTIVDNGGTFNLEYITTSGARPNGTFSGTTISNVYYIKLNSFAYTNPDNRSVTFDGTTQAALEAGLVLTGNITMTVNSSQTLQELAAPEVFAISDTDATWSAIPNATSYDVYVGGAYSYSTTGTTLSVSQSCTVSVVATAPGFVSSPMSNSCSMVGCFVEGTMITLSDFTQKPVEDITYSDNILVWDFDRGIYASSKPLWIQKKKTIFEYTQLLFEDGTVLKLVGPSDRVHRVFDYDNSYFEYGDHIALNSSVFKADSTTPKLIAIEKIKEEVNYYNIITTYHMNLFADSVLTSCGYNNIYPVKDMKFIKDNREVVTKEHYNLPDKWYYGLRLGEQDLSKRSIEKAHAYVANLEALDVNRN